ncbi:hypothetical protein NA56DRAFT_705967 [Hyaloscypha hepaticicola]|uniref:Uncharacterized protein n=1 Tax=Hyaloscypha hepaticicola TaxID=2082293 RepID=A0A2J6PY28_9HELO|nr:hypothetical protein NA56DRAFT_705967 [Hyaloscypha hepaticicola]
MGVLIYPKTTVYEFSSPEPSTIPSSAVVPSQTNRITAPRLATKRQPTKRNTNFTQATPSRCVSCTPSFDAEVARINANPINPEVALFTWLGGNHSVHGFAKKDDIMRLGSRTCSEVCIIVILFFHRRKNTNARNELLGESRAGSFGRDGERKTTSQR